MVSVKLLIGEDEETTGCPARGGGAQVDTHLQIRVPRPADSAGWGGFIWWVVISMRGETRSSAQKEQLGSSSGRRSIFSPGF